MCRDLFVGLSRVTFILFVVFVAALGIAWSADEQSRPNWNQPEALKKVKAVLAQEETSDFAWDKIDWVTVPEQAAIRAQRENKPILLYFFLKKDKGPKAAPS